MAYIENPKTKGSGVVCAIPQKGACPVKCPDCFFQSGRSYLEPLADTLPNLPSAQEARGRVVRMNDGNDSNIQRELVVEAAKAYPEVFFNTSIPKDLGSFPGPVVLTLNPGGMTNKSFHELENIPTNLMFVRFRVSTWNLALCDRAVKYYTERATPVPVVLTFLAFYEEDIPAEHAKNYSYRVRTLNQYHVITAEGWNGVAGRYQGNRYVYTCGKDADTHSCSRCGMIIYRRKSCKVCKSMSKSPLSPS